MAIRVHLLQECHTLRMQYLVRTMLSEGKYATQGVDDDRVAEMVREFAEDNGQTKACFVAVLDDAEVIGFFAVELMQYTFKRGLFASDVAFYVLPEWRGSFASAKLLLSVHEWAKDHYADALVVGITAPENEAHAERVYERVGFKRFGVVMRKEL